MHIHTQTTGRGGGGRAQHLLPVGRPDRLRRAEQGTCKPTLLPLIPKSSSTISNKSTPNPPSRQAEIAVSQQSHIKGFCDDGRRAHGGLTRGDRAFVPPGPQQQHQRARRRFLAHRGEGGRKPKKGQEEQSGQWAVDPWAFRMNVSALLLSVALTLILLRVRKRLVSASLARSITRSHTFTPPYPRRDPQPGAGRRPLPPRPRAGPPRGARRPPAPRAPPPPPPPPALARHQPGEQVPLLQLLAGPPAARQRHRPVRGIRRRQGLPGACLLTYPELLGSAPRQRLTNHPDSTPTPKQGPPMVSDGQAALRGLGAALLWIYTCRYLHHSDQLVRAFVWCVVS